MPDQCDNCDYSRPRTYGTKQVLECRYEAPSTTYRQGQVSQWAEVVATDWCGKYGPLGWTDPENIVVQGITLTTTTKTKVIEAPTAGHTLWVTHGNLTNTSINKAILVKFFDGDSSVMVGALTVPANQSISQAVEIRATTGQIWAQLDSTDGSETYVYLQGKQGRPQDQTEA